MNARGHAAGMARKLQLTRRLATMSGVVGGHGSVKADIWAFRRHHMWSATKTGNFAVLNLITQPSRSSAG